MINDVSVGHVQKWISKALLQFHQLNKGPGPIDYPSLIL